MDRLEGGRGRVVDEHGIEDAVREGWIGGQIEGEAHLVRHDVLVEAGLPDLDAGRHQQPLAVGEEGDVRGGPLAGLLGAGDGGREELGGEVSHRHRREGGKAAAPALPETDQHDAGIDGGDVGGAVRLDEGGDKRAGLDIGVQDGHEIGHGGVGIGLEDFDRRFVAERGRDNARGRGE